MSLKGQGDWGNYVRRLQGSVVFLSGTVLGLVHTDFFEAWNTLTNKHTHTHQGSGNNMTSWSVVLG